MHKSIVFIVFVITIVSVQCMTDEMKEKLQGVVTQCVKDTGVDPKVLEQARKKNFTDDPKLKAYYKCVSFGLKYLNEDGTWNMETILANTAAEDKDKVSAIAKECCTPANGRDLDEVAFEASKCFLTKYEKPVEV